MKTRLTAEERRDAVIAAAAIEFAAGGYAGTSTNAIAARAGVSQPYLFQLFRTKQDLFLAAVRACFDHAGRTFEEAGRAAQAAGLDTKGILEQMGHAYVRMLLADRNYLRLQLHAYAACADPDVRAVVRDEFFALWHRVARLSGADVYGLHQWFAQGMLINVIASVGDARTLEEFDATLLGGVVAGS
jgi:AcrR family transcriptional regulator